jgi:hypothetical protein
MLGLPGNKPSVLPEQLPSEQRERVAVLTILHEGKAFSPSEVYRLRDPESDPELARLPTLLEGLWAALAPGHSEGEPSRYLQAVMQRLRQAQQEIERTRQLVGLLREAKALHLREITHRHETLSVFQVTTEGLADRLEALDADHAGYAMILAERIEASQVGLAFNVHSRA